MRFPVGTTYVVPVTTFGVSVRPWQAVAFASSSTLISGGAGDCAPRVWDVGRPGKAVVNRKLVAHEAPVVAVVAGWDGPHTTATVGLSR
jgi:hypothetical protein